MGASAGSVWNEQNVRNALNTLNDGIERLTRDRAIVELRELRELIASLRQIESQLEQHVGSLMEGRELMVEGVGYVTRSHPKQSEQWDLQRLIKVVAARTADDAVDRETGEIMPRGALAELVAERIEECFGVRYGKKLGLKKYGVNWRDYYEAEYEMDRWKVRIQ